MAKKIKVGDLVDVITKDFRRFTCIVVKYYPDRRAFYGRVIDSYDSTLKTTRWCRYSIPQTNGLFILLDDLYSLTIISSCSEKSVTKNSAVRNISWEEKVSENHGSGGSSQEVISEESIVYRYVNTRPDCQNFASTDKIVFCTVHDSNGAEYGGWGRYRDINTQTYAERVAYEQAKSAMREITTPKGFKL